MSPGVQRPKNLRPMLQEVPMSKCCRKRDPFQGPKPGSCPTLGNELFEKTHVLAKQEILLGKGPWVESRRVREPGRTALPQLAAVSGFMVMGLVSRLSSANHSDSESFPVVPCPAKMDAREKDSGRWSDMRCLLLTFPELFRLVVTY